MKKYLLLFATVSLALLWVGCSQPASTPVQNDPASDAKNDPIPDAKEYILDLSIGGQSIDLTSSPLQVSLPYGTDLTVALPVKLTISEGAGVESLGGLALTAVPDANDQYVGSATVSTSAKIAFKVTAANGKEKTFDIAVQTPAALSVTWKGSTNNPEEVLTANKEITVLGGTPFINPNNSSFNSDESKYLNFDFANKGTEGLEIQAVMLELESLHEASSGKDMQGETGFKEFQDFLSNIGGSENTPFTISALQEVLYKKEQNVNYGRISGLTQNWQYEFKLKITVKSNDSQDSDFIFYMSGVFYA